MDLKIQNVRQFVIAATSGSFKTAATSTFRSQAAVSIAMRELENQIGGHLLEPGRRGKLTPLAHALLPLLQELLTVHDSVFNHARQLALGEHGALTVAVAPFLTEEWLPDVLAQFSQAYPHITVRAIEERSPQIGRLVWEGKVDIGITGLRASDPKLAFKPVAVDSFGVLCPTGHRLARGKTATWKSLRDEKLIGNDTFEALAGIGLDDYLYSPALEVSNRASLISCLRHNLGITILPMLTRPMQADGLAFVPLTRPRISRTIGIVTHGTQTLLPAGTRLESMLFRSLMEFAVRKGAVGLGKESS